VTKSAKSDVALLRRTHAFLLYLIHRLKAPALFGPDWRIAALAFSVALVITIAFYWAFNAIVISCAFRALDAPAYDSIVASSKTTERHEMPTDKQNCGPEQAWCVFDDAPASAPSWQTLETGLSAIRGYWRFATLITGKDQESIAIDGHTADEGSCAIDIRVQPEHRYANAIVASLIGAAPYFADRTPTTSSAGMPEAEPWWSNIVPTVQGLKRLEGNVKLRDLVYVARDEFGRKYLKRCPDALAKLDRFDAKLNEIIYGLRDHIYFKRWLLSTVNGEIQWFIVLFSVWCTALLGWRWWVLYVEGTAGSSPAQSFAPDWFKRRLTESATNTVDDAKQTVQRLHAEFRKELENGRSLEGWLADSLPLLGFIGTVFGMIDAMSFVNEVVAAEPGIELATAMGKVTGALAIAFRTTLLSLMFIIPLSRFIAMTYTAEDRYLHKVVSGL
jgi:hypothetical protein